MKRQNKTKSLWSLKIRFQSKKPISLVKVVFVTFCNAVKPDFYFPSLYFRNLQIKLAMLFLNSMHVWRKLETDMFSGNIKTSKYSVKVKEDKNFEQNLQGM